ncbi:MAG TPA: TlpA disulfide reductase family protein [Bacteroidales bacterium]|nr:TlpA disulfide reductase family protein [Bacteroidales bacterium]HRZ76692.1 TlpA disulfide reductase family protein [Bacteroidales bacterium]
MGLALLALATPSLATVPEVRIKVVDFEGFKKELEAQDDTVRIINFWATWCLPCLKELPDFERTARERAGNRVAFIFVSLDNAEQLDTRVIPFLREREAPARHFLLDDPGANRWIPLVSGEWSGAIPATLIYRSGKRKFHEGMMSYDELNAQINGML